MGWTTVQLAEYLSRNGIPESAYSFNADKDEAFCISKVGQDWLVYYSVARHKERTCMGEI